MQEAGIQITAPELHRLRGAALEKLHQLVATKEGRSQTLEALHAFLVSWDQSVWQDHEKIALTSFDIARIWRDHLAPEWLDRKEMLQRTVALRPIPSEIAATANEAIERAFQTGSPALIGHHAEEPV